MTKPIRIQRSRKNKQASPNGLPIVYVGRPSKWGNPFRKNGDAVDVVSKFRDMMMNLNSHSVDDDTYKRFKLMRDTIYDLRGCNLSCWCRLGESCHADILIELSNI